MPTGMSVTKAQAKRGLCGQPWWRTARTYVGTNRPFPRGQPLKEECIKTHGRGVDVSPRSHVDDSPPVMTVGAVVIVGVAAA